MVVEIIILLVFQAIIDALEAEVFHNLPPAVIHQFVVLAMNFESWSKASLADFADSVMVKKLLVANCFVLAMKRAISLISIGKDVQQIIKNDSIVMQLVADWRRVEFGLINEYTSWSCQWQVEFLAAGAWDWLLTAFCAILVQNEIIVNLKRKTSVQNWGVWLESLVQKSVSHSVVEWCG